MPSPQPAKRDSGSPSRRRGRVESRPDVPPAPPPPARRTERSSPARETLADEQTGDRRATGLR
eukprot:6050253-Alexandrium_andersonii.AAC.1